LQATRFYFKDIQIDYLFYANNYDAPKEQMRIFDSIEEAIPVYEKGERVANGTTSEMGKVHNYFANPFDPVQLPNKDLFISMYVRKESLLSSH
jgi:hypothetical protein